MLIGLHSCFSKGILKFLPRDIGVVVWVGCVLSAQMEMASLEKDRENVMGFNRSSKVLGFWKGRGHRPS